MKGVRTLPAAARKPEVGEDRQFVTALARGLDVLRCFSAGRAELGTSEIGEMTGMPQPTVWRLCHTLTQLGYLVPGTRPGKLRAGASVLALGSSSLAGLQFNEIIRPHMQEFIRHFPAAVVLAERQGLSLVYIERCDGHATFLFNMPVGTTVSLYESPAGCVCLAGMAPAARQAALDAIKSVEGERWPEIQRRVDRVAALLKRDGVLTSDAYAEHNPEIGFAAVPVASGDPERAFTLLCGGPAASLPATLLTETIAPKLRQLAAIISLALPAKG
jgi:DNA-binding IclR family transcriptional regulator